MKVHTTAASLDHWTELSRTARAWPQLGTRSLLKGDLSFAPSGLSPESEWETLLRGSRDSPVLETAQPVKCLL